MQPLDGTKPIVPSWAVLIAANAVPIFGVLFGGWGVFPLIFLYWVENGIVGVVTVAKLVKGQFTPPASRGDRIGGVVFFMIHYDAEGVWRHAECRRQRRR